MIPSTTSPATPPSRETPVIPSEALLRGGQQVVIAHANQSYTLRLTRQGKLILTK
jgi:hemin uptake protein HemP